MKIILIELPEESTDINMEALADFIRRGIYYNTPDSDKYKIRFGNIHSSL